jgi:tetratricopeptide (TPR) repeat protein
MKKILSVIMCRLAVCTLLPCLAQSYDMGFFEKNMLAAANSLYDKGDYEGAFLKYEELRDKYPDNPLSYYGMGCVWYAAGNYEMAINRFKIVIKMEPKLSHAYYWLGNTYWKMGRRSEAISQWNECLKINPEDESARAKLKSAQ